MRLRSIKLAGFKSFVDPTNISLPSDCIAVVGPNGCGKSNVIDAVRWVMGEISAKYLRGDTMADVVFNGSSSRKPVSKASVELVFDNSEGRLEGRMASYAEVAVRREVTREGQSSYFLNGVRCRRRDVMDVFLGTGLGPRSYAIIEQGMISRVIEARPEELREFLEEAAGISKYKERRRETENRMRHTQENLERLSDLREELGKRLTHLKRQATIAERYREFKAQERTLARELEALRWGRLDAQLRQREQQSAAQQNALDAALAGQRKLEAEIERHRVAHADASEQYNEHYRKVLEVGAAVARREESIAALRARGRQLASELERERVQLERARSEVGEDRERELSLSEEIERREPELEALRDSLDDAAERLEVAELGTREWQSEYQVLSDRLAEPLRAQHAEQVRIEELESNETALGERLGQVESNLLALDEAPIEARLQQAREGLEIAEEQLVDAERGQADTEAGLRAAREQARVEQDAVYQLQQQIQARAGRRASLDALQQQALGKSRDATMAWLRAQGLSDARRLGECVGVESGWERALEAVLGARLEAVLVADLDSHAGAIGAVEDGSVTLLEGVGLEGAGRRTEQSPAQRPAHGLASLLSLVAARELLGAWLQGVYVCDTLDQALGVRAQLGIAEQIVTRDGVMLGADWVTAVDAESAQAGVLARGREIEELAGSIEAASFALETRQAALDEARDRAETLEHALREAQAQVSRTHRSGAELAAQVRAVEAALAQHRERARTLQGDREDLSERLERARESLLQARERLELSTEQAEHLELQKREWESERDSRTQALEAARAGHQSARDRAYQLNVDLEALRGELNSLQSGRHRGAERIEYLDARCAQIAQEQTAIEAPLAEAEQQLGAELETQRAGDQSLQVLRDQVESLELATRRGEAERNSAQSQVERERESLARLRLESEEVRVRRETVAEKLSEEGVSPDQVLESIESPDAEESVWAKRLDELATRINRLGAINLAAIEEFEQQSERKTYLDAQNADLSEALETLQSAIAKIDRETRARFKETFERVNTGFSRLFPRLFGGGEAELRMTDGDLLSAGVSVMARPPGKRNSSIQLLSGGEKALTAVAFTFAIFELNPAPFCLLDEVDAPLDDANVGRFGQLVREMSERVQMLLITHNKITMEIAQQLVGVTMHEPGVSRLVAVDIDAAVQLATA